MSHFEENRKKIYEENAKGAKKLVELLRDGTPQEEETLSPENPADFIENEAQKEPFADAVRFLTRIARTTGGEIHIPISQSERGILIATAKKELVLAGDTLQAFTTVLRNATDLELSATEGVTEFYLELPDVYIKKGSEAKVRTPLCHPIGFDEFVQEAEKEIETELRNFAETAQIAETISEAKLQALQTAATVLLSLDFRYGLHEKEQFYCNTDENAVSVRVAYDSYLLLGSDILPDLAESLAGVDTLSITPGKEKLYITATVR